MSRDNFSIEIHKGKEIIVKLNEIEGIIRILKITDILKNNMVERIKNIKEILKEAKLKEIR